MPRRKRWQPLLMFAIPYSVGIIYKTPRAACPPRSRHNLFGIWSGDYSKCNALINTATRFERWIEIGLWRVLAASIDCARLIWLSLRFLLLPVPLWSAIWFRCQTEVYITLHAEVTFYFYKKWFYLSLTYRVRNIDITGNNFQQRARKIIR